MASLTNDRSNKDADETRDARWCLRTDETEAPRGTLVAFRDGPRSVRFHPPHVDERLDAAARCQTVRTLLRDLEARVRALPDVEYLEVRTGTDERGFDELHESLERLGFFQAQAAHAFARSIRAAIPRCERTDEIEIRPYSLKDANRVGVLLERSATSSMDRIQSLMRRSAVEHVSSVRTNLDHEAGSLVALHVSEI